MIMDGAGAEAIQKMAQRREFSAAQLQIIAGRKADTVFTFVRDDVRGGWHPVTPVSAWLMDALVR